MSKNSKKKLKWLIPIAVLSVTCMSAGMLAGCGGNDGDHTHAYEWKSDENEHWKECPADGVEEEGSRGTHVFEAGECECGAIEIVKTYGKVTGKITLRKLGGTETDFSDVVIDMGDDEVDLEINRETGTFTVDNVVVGKNYPLTVSKPGYQNYAVTVQVAEEGETVTIGGERGIVLEYNVFGFLIGWDADLHDFSHANDADPYVMFRKNVGGKSFNVITNESYKNVSATVGLNFNNSKHSQHSHGLAIKFEDGKHIILRFHYNSDANCGIQFTNNLWGGMADNALAAANSLLDDGEFFNQYGENWIYMFDSDEVAEIKGEEKLPLTAVLQDGKLIVLYKNAYIYSCDLPEGYGDKNSQIVLWSWDGGDNAVFEYKITEEIPAMQAALKVDVTQPDGAGCTVTANPAKDKYAYGETIELDVTPASGYLLDSLTVNGKDMFNSVKNGKLTILADRENVEVKAEYVVRQEVPLNLTIKGKKLGKTANLAKDTQVTLSGIDTPFTVNADGKITADSITLGRYTVSVAGYVDKEIVLTEDLNEIVLEYDAFKVICYDAAGHDLSHVNDDDPYIEFKGPGLSMDVLSKEKLYDNVSLSIVLKDSTSTDGDRQQGVILQFEDGKVAVLNINIAGTPRLQFRPELWQGDSGLVTAFEKEWVEFRNVTPEEVAKYQSETGIKLTLERRGSSLYAYLDGVFHGKADLPEQYADDKVGIGFFAMGAVSGSKWYFEVSETLSNLGATVTDATAENAHGSIAIAPDKISIGDTVTVTVTPDADYVLDMLTVSGGALTKQENGTYTFVATLSEHTVTATFKSAIVAITDATATDANGSVSFTTGKILFGDTVTITVTPAAGYILNKLTVVDGDSKAVEITNKGDGTYTFVATVNTYTVTGTFIEKPAQAAEANVSGIGLGNTPVDFEGKTVTLTPEEGTAVELTVTNGKISQILAPGKYTLSVDGYYSVEVTVGTDGAFEGITEVKFEKIVFKHNMLGDRNIGDPNKVDYSSAAKGGCITVKEKTDVYGFTVDRYNNAVFTAKFKKQDGSQGLFMAFGKEANWESERESVCLNLEGNNLKFQGNWLWGLRPLHWEKWEFGPEGAGANYARPMSNALLEKYAGEGIEISLVRKDGAVYVFIEKELYAIQVLGDYGERDVCFAIWASNAAAGYQIPFTVGNAADADKMLNDVTDAIGARSVLGKWTATDSTIGVSGDGFVELTHEGVQTKESLTLNLKDGYSNGGNKAQGILYRFNDGRWLAVRIERKNNDKENLAYIQFSEDALVPNGGGCLKTGWNKAGNRDLTAAELAAFDNVSGNGIDLTLIRDGRLIYVFLGDTLLDMVTLNEKYATMDGTIGATIEKGTGTAFAYEHKVGDEAIPTGYHTVKVSVKDGAAHGYSVNVEPLVKNGENVTLTIQTSDANAAWSYFPNAITVNGTPIDFTTVTRESLGANRCKYTYTLTNVTADTAIEVTIGAGTKVGYDVTVNNAEQGSIKCDMETYGNTDYYWNDLCTWTITAKEGYEMEKIVIGEGANAQTITEGWTANNNVYTYNYLVVGDIKAVAHFKEAQGEQPGVNAVSTIEWANMGTDAQNLDSADYKYYEIYGETTTAQTGKNDLILAENVSTAAMAEGNFPITVSGSNATVNKGHSINTGSSFTFKIKVVKGMQKIQIFFAQATGATMTASYTMNGNTGSVQVESDGAMQMVKISLNTDDLVDGTDYELTVTVSSTADGLQCAACGVRSTTIDNDVTTD